MDRLQVRRFQSIEDADLALGGLTVVVGRSNSGKSAFIRAIRALAENVTSPSWVRVGAKAFVVSMTDSDDVAVSLERGKGSSTYRVLRGGAEETYAKSGTSVPDEVSAQLALDADLQIAGQFDPPFLLATTGTEAARVLGELTNATTLHEAAREANRRRTEALRLAKVRRQDAADAHTRLTEEYIELPAQAEAVRQARSVFDEVTDVAVQARKLATLVGAEREARRDIDAEKYVVSLTPDLDLTEVESEVAYAAKLEGLLADLRAAELTVWEATNEERDGRREADDLDAEYRAVLDDLGECPLCGRSV